MLKILSVDIFLLQLAQGLLLWKDNQYFYKSKNSLKEQKLGTIKLDYEKKLSAAKHALELAETEQAKEKSEESCQQKIQKLEHTQAQLTEKIENQEAELDTLKLKVAELEKSREDNLKSYQKMVGEFLKAFKSKTQRILLTQKSNLDFFDLKKVKPSDLAKIAVEEEVAKKSVAK